MFGRPAGLQKANAFSACTPVSARGEPADFYAHGLRLLAKSNYRVVTFTPNEEHPKNSAARPVPDGLP
jgi:hypothetical protein